MWSRPGTLIWLAWPMTGSRVTQYYLILSPGARHSISNWRLLSSTEILSTMTRRPIFKSGASSFCWWWSSSACKKQENLSSKNCRRTSSSTNTIGRTMWWQSKNLTTKNCQEWVVLWHEFSLRISTYIYIHSRYVSMIYSRLTRFGNPFGSCASMLHTTVIFWTFV